jgi:hypothetical protein
LPCKHTLLPFDDCLYALQATVPHLSRSSLHRSFQRHGIARLPETEGVKPGKKKFRANLFVVDGRRPPSNCCIHWRLTIAPGKRLGPHDWIACPILVCQDASHYQWTRGFGRGI